MGVVVHAKLMVYGMTKMKNRKVDTSNPCETQRLSLKTSVILLVEFLRPQMSTVYCSLCLYYLLPLRQLYKLIIVQYLYDDFFTL